MEKRLTRLHLIYSRAEQRPAPFRHEVAPDWRAVPWQDPAAFAALTEGEKVEWGDLMTAFHAAGAYHRHKDDRAFSTRLAVLDNKIDWHADAPRIWPVVR